MNVCLRPRSLFQLLAALVTVGALSAPSSGWAGGATQFRLRDAMIPGYLALPKGAGTHPAVVVIPEWWGLNNWVKHEADSLAAHGYVALAVDLYHGKVATDESTAHQLMSGLIEE